MMNDCWKLRSLCIWFASNDCWFVWTNFFIVHFTVYISLPTFYTQFLPPPFLLSFNSHDFPRLTPQSTVVVYITITDTQHSHRHNFSNINTYCYYLTPWELIPPILTASLSLKSGWYQCIRADFNSAVVWMGSIFPLISSSSNFFYRLSATVPMFPSTILITVTFLFLSCISSLGSDGADLVLKIWGMCSVSLLPLLSGPLWHGMVVPVRVSSMDQIQPLKNLTVWK